MRSDNAACAVNTTRSGRGIIAMALPRQAGRHKACVLARGSSRGRFGALDGLTEIDPGDSRTVPRFRLLAPSLVAAIRHEEARWGPRKRGFATEQSYSDVSPCPLAVSRRPERTAGSARSNVRFAGQMKPILVPLLCVAMAAGAATVR